MYKNGLKRVIDFLLSILAVVLLSPVFLAIYVLVLFINGKPVIFKQRRPGMNSRIFTMFKFRTMNDKVDLKGELLPDELRLTKFGKFLRKSSLDELPELFNIIKGDMSIVGPRPLLVEYLKEYSVEERKRHDVRPGLTGLAQVNGRNLLSWEEKFKYDLEYVDKVNLVLDLKIIFRTFRVLLSKKGINNSENRQMEVFRRSDNHE